MRSLSEITGLDRAACIMDWEQLTGLEVPKHLSVEFMRRALAYEQQCKKFGGVPASTKRTLSAVACGKSVSAAVCPLFKSGTHLVREWNGRTYQVRVIDDGFELDGKRYKSLSAIARKITGARWSGPRFFGLINRSKNVEPVETNSSSDLQINKETGSAP